MKNIIGSFIFVWMMMTDLTVTAVLSSMCNILIPYPLFQKNHPSDGCAYG